MTNILFRVDSSSTIGAGHIMRDLVLASQFKEANIIFATQNLEGNINHKIKEIGYKIEILNSNNIKELDDLVKKYDVDIVVIDHYGIDYEYEKQLKTKNPKLKILSFDDIYKKHYCDILLNHNIYADKNRYKDLVTKECELRCGSEFTLIRDEFKNEKETIREKIYDIFIAMGGADTKKLSLKIIKLIPNNFKIIITTTTANKNLDDLKAYVQDRDNIDLHINSNQIAKLINESRFAIITPSVIACELMYLNIPFLTIKTAENQKYMFEYLLENGYKAIDDFKEDVFTKAAVELKNFIYLSCYEKKMVLSWRNHINIKRWMFSKNDISLKSHLAYINFLKKRDDKRYFLVNYLGKDIGVIDFIDIDNFKAEIGLYAKPNINRVGSILMQQIIEYGFKKLNLKKLIAKVYEDNILAINLYKKFKFKKIDKVDSIIIMERQR